MAAAVKTCKELWELRNSWAISVFDEFERGWMVKQLPHWAEKINSMGGGIGIKAGKAERNFLA